MKILSSLESLNSLFEWSSVLLLGLTFIAGAGTIVTSRILNQRQSKTILRLETAASQARTAQQRVQIELGETQKEVAGAKTKQAEAERQLINIQERFRPRMLARSKFIEALQNAPRGKVEISVITGDPESFAFADSIWAALRDAGFDVGNQVTPFMIFGETPVGLTLGVKDVETPPLHAAPIQKAFEAAGVHAAGRAPFGSDLNVVYIQVGLKPQ